MKARELRTTNLVYNLYNQVEMVRSIVDDYSVLGLYAIPLTEEWLMKLGFENWDKNKWIDSNSVLTISKNGDNFLCLFNQRHIDIFHVHQLQNLYFGITGEDLIVKQ